MNYAALLSEQTYALYEAYLEALCGQTIPGRRLATLLAKESLTTLTPRDLIRLLVQTKQPRIFAETEVFGDGRDWQLQELSLLGDVSVAVPVTVFDDGRHQRPTVHKNPFKAVLLFVPGVLLRNDTGHPAADWDAVVQEGNLDPQAYLEIYTRRLLPGLRYGELLARNTRRRWILTLPGLGCGQFAGPFKGRLATHLEQVLSELLKRYASELPNLDLVYFDPYREGSLREEKIHHLNLRTRPFCHGSPGRPQLCPPNSYAEGEEDFSEHLLCSMVAWDHVSWPGNDFYAGARATDDGVKAAATSAMQALTGFEGVYDSQQTKYLPPSPFNSWGELVATKGLALNIEQNLYIAPL